MFSGCHIVTQNRSNKFPRLDQNGSVIIYFMIIIAVLAILVTSGAQTYVTLSQTNQRERAAVDAQNLMDSINMVFGTQNNIGNCAVLLTAGSSFATELSAKIADPNYQTAATLALPFPGPGAALVSPGMVYGSVKVESVSIGRIGYVPGTTHNTPANFSMIGSIVVKFSNYGTGGAPKSFQVPFYYYFSGAPTCYTSLNSLADPQSTALQTYEDLVCTMQTANTPHYDPAVPGCI